MQDIAFQKALASVMLDNKYDRFVKNRKTGKLDTRSLYKINTSNKLFKRREARQNKHYAVSLVIDVSSSMRGPKIQFAAEAAVKLSHHLGAIGIPHNIVLYGLGAFERKPFSPKAANKLLREQILGVTDYSSAEHSLYNLYENETSVKNKKGGYKMLKFLGRFPNNGKDNYQIEQTYKDKVTGEYTKHVCGFGGTSIGEAIRFSRECLMRQKGKRIMIFLTDGDNSTQGRNYESPNFPGFSQEDFDPKHEIDITLKMGIEYYGIGVLHDDIKDYSPAKRTACLSKLDQLYPHIIHMIKKNLKRG